MLLFMVGGGLGSYALLRSLERKVWSRLARRLKLSWLGEVSEDIRLLAVVSGALLSVAAGLLVLSGAG